MPELEPGNVPNLDDLTSMLESQEEAPAAPVQAAHANPAPALAELEQAIAEAEQNSAISQSSEPQLVATRSVATEAENIPAEATDSYLVAEVPTDIIPIEETELKPIPVVLTEVVPADIPPAPAAPSATAPGTIRSGESQGGIEILVELAAKGDINPQDIDIIEVTDLFLRAIAAAPKENLRQSGKILFHASVLLRMKAEAWLDLQDQPFGDDFLEFDADGSPIIYDSQREPIARQITIQDLERALVRRSHIHNIRTRRVTLEQLIEALREAERLEKFRVQRKAEPRIELAGHHEVNDVEDILELAHEEDIETVIAKVEQILAESLNPEELTPFIKLIKLLDRKGDWVDAFLAILFLSNSGKINLQQEQFYGPLFITRADAPPPPAPPALQPS